VFKTNPKDPKGYSGQIVMIDPREIAGEFTNKNIRGNESIMHKITAEALKQGVDPNRALAHGWYETLMGRKSIVGTSEDAYRNPLQYNWMDAPDRHVQMWQELFSEIFANINMDKFERAKRSANMREKMQAENIAGGIRYMKKMMKESGPLIGAMRYKGAGPEARTYGREIVNEMIPYLEKHPDVQRIIKKERDLIRSREPIATPRYPLGGSF
jgi:hypothetical protein